MYIYLYIVCISYIYIYIYWKLKTGIHIIQLYHIYINMEFHQTQHLDYEMTISVFTPKFNIDTKNVYAWKERPFPNMPLCTPRCDLCHYMGQGTHHKLQQAPWHGAGSTQAHHPLQAVAYSPGDHSLSQDSQTNLDICLPGLSWPNHFGYKAC